MRMLKTKTVPGLFLALTLVCAALPGAAQAGKLELQNLEKLTKKAAVFTEVTLDGAMLGLATKVLDMSGDSEARQVKDAIKGVTGIYIKNFEFDEPNQYDQSDVQAIRSQLMGPGWSRIVGSVNKRSGEHSEIFILKAGDKIAGLAILVAEPRELTVVNIVGFVDMDKISVLGGKFGIPDDIKDKSDDRPRHRPVAQPRGVVQPRPVAQPKADPTPDKDKDKSDQEEHDDENLAE